MKSAKSPDPSPMDFCVSIVLKRALGKLHSRTLNGHWKVAQKERDKLNMMALKKVLHFMEN